MGRNMFYETFLRFPCPKTLNAWWGFGACLLFTLLSQIVTGLMLSIYYHPDTRYAMSSCYYIMRDIRGGWFVRHLHVGGASLMFVCVYIHIGRGMYYGSHLNKLVWYSGLVMLLLLMGIAFLGYVLPWGELSYWAAVVIVNMLTIIPYIGKRLTYLAWGSYVPSTATLKRFFILHFVLPFVLLGLSGLHVFFIHSIYLSNNPLGIQWQHGGIPFHPYYTANDMLAITGSYGTMLLVVLWYPDVLYEPMNYKIPDPMKTPKDIRPEWYFLCFYAVLRSIPSKTWGVLGMLGVVGVLALLPYLHTGRYKGFQFYSGCQVLFWVMVGDLVFLFLLGRMRSEGMVPEVSAWATGVYYSYYVLYPIAMWVHDRMSSLGWEKEYMKRSQWYQKG